MMVRKRTSVKQWRLMEPYCVPSAKSRNNSGGGVQQYCYNDAPYSVGSLAPSHRTSHGDVKQQLGRLSRGYASREG
jgi:hypothetical protein